MELNKIYNSDCLEGLKTMPDESVDCCVTSPPYFGLRDYGTVKWEGGDENCNHVRDTKNANPDWEIQTRAKVANGVGDAIYKYLCGKCGAKRIDNQIGLEETPEAFVSKMVQVFSEVKRVLKKEGTCWLNLGDTYNAYKANTGDTPFAGNSGRPEHKKGLTTTALKNKDLIGVPWMVAFALRSAGWYLRQDIIWHKPNPMPESVTDRCTKAHEYIFLLSKSARYYYDADAIKYPSINWTSRKDLAPTERKRFPTTLINGVRNRNKEYDLSNKRSVWTVVTQGFSDAHFATFPEDLIVDCIKAGCPESGVVLDPFMGAGTTALVASKLNRNYIGFELNPEYIEIAKKRLQKELGMFNKNVA